MENGPLDLRTGIKKGTGRENGNFPLDLRTSSRGQDEALDLRVASRKRSYDTANKAPTGVKEVNKVLRVYANHLLSVITSLKNYILYIVCIE